MNKINKNKEPKIGDIFLVNFSGSDSEQNGLRPGLVFQNNVGNEFSPNLIMLPLTTSIKKMSQPTHVFLPKEVGLLRDSIILCENPERISKKKLVGYITTLDNEYMSKVAVGSLLSSSAISFIDPDLLLSVWQEALALNAIAV